VESTAPIMQIEEYSEQEMSRLAEEGSSKFPETSANFCSNSWAYIPENYMLHIKCLFIMSLIPFFLSVSLNYRWISFYLIAE
jgi:hypothetical protein